MIKRLIWLVFAIIFYQSGLAFTILIMEPSEFTGGFQWVWVLLFPILLPAFFIINKHLGCASCEDGQCSTLTEKHQNHKI
ncbi:MAG: hypothetical protein KAG43_02645 [Candidatus Marithrix sp.]|nr:hypothetical protein [Candidatus Marithrix sp.]